MWICFLFFAVDLSVDLGGGDKVGVMGKNTVENRNFSINLIKIGWVSLSVASSALNVSIISKCHDKRLQKMYLQKAQAYSLLVQKLEETIGKQTTTIAAELHIKKSPTRFPLSIKSVTLRQEITMEKHQNTPAEAFAIFNKAFLIAENGSAPVTLTFYDGARRTGIIKLATYFFGNRSVPSDALPHRSDLELIEADEKINTYDIFTIKSLQ